MIDPQLETIGSFLRKVRQNQKKALSEIAQLTGYTPNYISLIEQTKREPSISVLNKICNALNVPIHTVILAVFLNEDLNSKCWSGQLDFLTKQLLYLKNIYKNDHFKIEKITRLEGNIYIDRQLEKKGVNKKKELSI